MERMWLWTFHSSPTGRVCCLKWSWCPVFTLVWGKILKLKGKEMSAALLDLNVILSAGVMAVRCSPSMAPGSNARIVMTSTSVKIALRLASTTQDTPLAGSTSLVSHRLINCMTVESPRCLLICCFLNTRPVSGFLWPFRKTAEEASQQPAGDANWWLVSCCEEPERVILR